jgi:hypothetical protein
MKNNAVCSDYSRQIVKYKNDDGLVVKDPELTVILPKIFKSIQSKHQKFDKMYGDEIILKMEQNGEYWGEVLDKKNEIDIGFCQIVNGKKNPLAMKLSKTICSKLVVDKPLSTDKTPENEVESDREQKLKIDKTFENEVSAKESDREQKLSSNDPEFFPYKNRPVWSVHRQTNLIFNSDRKVIGRLETDEENGRIYLDDLREEDIVNCSKYGFEIEE